MKNSFLLIAARVAALSLLWVASVWGQVDLVSQKLGARTWTDNKGQKIQAGLESADDTSVTLRLPNGKTTKIAVAQLSADDQKYVANWLKNNAVPEGFGKVDQTIVITAEKGNLRYDKARFTVFPEKNVRVILRNIDDMPHNIVICKRGKKSAERVAEEALKLGAEGFNKHWIPEHSSVLFASRMADPHSTATIYFKAPKKVGNYPFVCTLPGHSQIMKGVMEVSRFVNPLSELTFTLYKGGWDKLPDFEKLTPEGTDHVESGKFDLGCTTESENFGLVFNGKLTTTKDGEHLFTVGSDDGTRLLLNGKVVIDHDGIHGMSAKGGKIALKRGVHDIEVQYFEKSGEEALYVGWRPPGAKREQSLSTGSAKTGGGTSGHLLVAEGEARIYRNFIKGAGPRAIGVGYPDGQNLAYDANNMRIAMIWQGDFIDAARHWSGRGQGFQPPAEADAIVGAPGVPFGVVATADQAWPAEFQRADNAQEPPLKGGYIFKGYRLNGEARTPSFRYLFGGLTIEDNPVPVGAAGSPDCGFERTLTVKGKAVANLYFRAAVAPSIEADGKGGYQIGEGAIMTIKAASKPILRTSNGQQELLVPVTLKDGSATITQTILWQ